MTNSANALGGGAIIPREKMQTKEADAVCTTGPVSAMGICNSIMLMDTQAIRPWTLAKYRKEFKANRLRVLCRRHNILDGVERKKLKKISEEKNSQRKITPSRDRSGTCKILGVLQVGGTRSRYTVIKFSDSPDPESCNFRGSSR